MNGLKALGQENRSDNEMIREVFPACVILPAGDKVQKSVCPQKGTLEAISTLSRGFAAMVVFCV